jgi:hypothetical protein
MSLIVVHDPRAGDIISQVNVLILYTGGKPRVVQIAERAVAAICPNSRGSSTGGVMKSAVKTRARSGAIR